MQRFCAILLGCGLTLACGGKSVGVPSDGAADTGTAGSGGEVHGSIGTSGAATGGSLNGNGNDTAGNGALSGGGFAAAGGVASAGSAGSLLVDPMTSAGAGGVSAAPDGILRSSGCGKDLPPEQVRTVPGSRTGYTAWTVQQTGATLGSDDPGNAGSRQYYVRVPFDYDNTRPYRVVYLGQGCGAQHAGNTNTFPLFNEQQGGSEQVVYVALSVPDNGDNPGCYDNNTGAGSQEWEAFDLVHTAVESTYCVDNNRIFVAGYSSGAWLANMWGCYFAGTPSPPLDEPDVTAGRKWRKFAPHWAIRGHLGVTGSMPDNEPAPCNGPAAGFYIFDELDRATNGVRVIAALNMSLAANGCTGDYLTGAKEPWAPAEQIAGLQGGICQRYTGCPKDTAERYPLVFCTTSGRGHSDQSSSAIPAFTQFMQLLDPAP